MEKAIRRYWPIFVLPTFLAFILGFIAPFAMGVYLSFCKFTTVTDAKFIGFSNYLKIFTDASFVHANCSNDSGKDGFLGIFICR